MLQIYYSLIHKLEVQVGQIANILSKPYAGTLLPSDLMKISKEHINDSPSRRGQEDGRQSQEHMTKSHLEDQEIMQVDPRRNDPRRTRAEPHMGTKKRAKPKSLGK